MKKVIRLTEQDISNIIDETLSLMCENKGVTFNGEAYPDGGWAVIVVGGVASGKSTVEKNKLLINGKIINSDHWREMVADAINTETSNPDSAVTHIKNTPQFTNVKDKLGDNVDLTNSNHVNIINTLSTEKNGFNLTHKQKQALLAANANKPSNRLPNLLFEIGGKYEERIPEIIQYLEKFKEPYNKQSINPKKEKNIQQAQQPEAKTKYVFNLRFTNGKVEQIHFSTEEELFNKLKKKNYSDGVINKLMSQKKNIEPLNESVVSETSKGYKISVVWVLSNRQVAFASMLNRDRQVGPISFHKSHNFNTDKEVGVIPVINSVKDKIDEAWCILTSTFDSDNGNRIDRRLNDIESRNNVIKLDRDENGDFVLPESITFGDSENPKMIDDIIGNPRSVRTYNGSKKEGPAKAMPNQDDGELSYEQYPTTKNANDWADSHNGQFMKNVDVFRNRDKKNTPRDHSTLFENKSNKHIQLTHDVLDKILSECVKHIFEGVDEYGFSVVKYGNRGRGNSPKFYTVYDNSDENGNFVYDLTQITDPMKRKEAFQSIVNGEKLPREIPGIKPQSNGIDLDTRTTIDRGTESNNPYISSASNEQNDVLMFIKNNYNIITMLLNPQKYGISNDLYSKTANNIRILLNNKQKTKQDYSEDEINNLITNTRSCLNQITTTFNSLHRNKKQQIGYVELIDSKCARKQDGILIPTDYLIMVSGLLAGIFTQDNIDYYATKYSKTAGFYNNRQKLLKSKTNISYYKSVVPSTSVEVITLFPFKDFGGTELLKADSLSTSNSVINDIYANGDKNISRIPVQFMDNSKESFLNISVQHAWEVLNKKERYTPNYIICVPSTARFNEEYIKRLSNANPKSKSFEAFIIKDWLNYKVDKETEDKIKNYLSFLDYRGNDRLDKTVKNVTDMIKRGVSNTALYMVSKVLKEYLFDKYPETNEFRNAFVRYYIQKLQSIDTAYQSLLDIGEYKEYVIPKKKFQDIQNNRNLENMIINAIKTEFEPHIKNGIPFKIDISKIEYKDKPQQMTSLVRSGGTGGAISGQLLRPLIADVYVINEPQYELTVDGKKMIEEMQLLQNSLNEKQSVELAHQKILIFDDDIDTGTSLKLTINALNRVLTEANINNTMLKCLTLFGKTSDAAAKVKN